ncbi:MAG: hypothetical protein JW727_03785 [Candidatus Aenigmarchaeota archaeon]|nr:hypothetical protein [Candidatus Aenigmarchaeota archaeon]
MGCGVMAVINQGGNSSAETFGFTRYLLEELKTRGQQGCGITMYDDSGLQRYRGLGLPKEVFAPTVIENSAFRGKVGIGHTRYKTKGKNSPANAHPVRVSKNGLTLDLTMNGEISEHHLWRDELERKGVDFYGSGNDTSTIGGILLQECCEKKDPLEALESTYNKIFGYGGFTLIGLYKDPKRENDCMFYARDGIRPLSRCEFSSDQEDFIAFASETAPFENLGGKNITEVNAGEIGVYNIGSGEFETKRMDRSNPPCFFEYVYEMRPDSLAMGKPLNYLRQALGGMLKLEHPAVPNAIIVGLPNSGLSYGGGYGATDRNIFMKNPTQEFLRSFMFDQPELRKEKARNGLSVIGEVRDRPVIMVDDSIVRNTVGPVAAEKLRKKGASEVHIRVGSPPIIGPCGSGIDTHMEDLIVTALKFDPRKVAENHEAFEKKLAEHSGFDSVGYLSNEGAKKICGNCCYGCVKGIYPYHFEGLEKTPFSSEADIG